jgi:NAD(P)-dependent dehydrogenase (short-subunit alcohol dehydrogenase family)
MRVFVTGASGGIGSAVTAELLTAGHEVLGLARSEDSAQTILDAGGTPLQGNLSDLDSIRAGAEQAAGVINLAFSNDFAQPAGGHRGVGPRGAHAPHQPGAWRAQAHAPTALGVSDPGARVVSSHPTSLSLIGGHEQPLFVAVLLLGLIFEGGWVLRSGTNACTKQAAAGR